MYRRGKKLVTAFFSRRAGNAAVRQKSLYPCPQGQAGCARGAMRQDRPDFPE